MSRVRTRFPTVFVGHPFADRFPVKKFRKLFDELPFKVLYGNTDVKTEHLLQIMKSLIHRCDYAIFDLSDWNSNVALELGLAEGLKKKTLKPYYILLNSRRSGEVPADLRGLQRLEYTKLDYSQDIGLGNLLIKFLLTKEHSYKKISRQLYSHKNTEKIIRFCLYIVAHLRDHEKLALENLRKLSRGLRLRKKDRELAIELMVKSRLLKMRNTKPRVYVKRLKLF